MYYLVRVLDQNNIYLKKSYLNNIFEFHKGLDMPDNDYGPRPDERERLVKRYPAPTKESNEAVSR